MPWTHTEVSQIVRCSCLLINHTVVVDLLGKGTINYSALS